MRRVIFICGQVGHEVRPGNNWSSSCHWTVVFGAKVPQGLSSIGREKWHALLREDPHSADAVQNSQDLVVSNALTESKQACLDDARTAPLSIFEGGGWKLESDVQPLPNCHTANTATEIVIALS